MDEFLKELRDLLVKHNASLCCDVEGDTHGVSCNFEVTVGKQTVVVNRYCQGLDASDIQEYLDQ